MVLIVASAVVQAVVLQRIKAGPGGLAARGGRGARARAWPPRACSSGSCSPAVLPGRLGLRQRVHRVLAGLHRDRAGRAGLAGDPDHALPGHPEIFLVEQPPTYAEAFAVQRFQAALSAFTILWNYLAVVAVVALGAFLPRALPGGGWPEAGGSGARSDTGGYVTPDNTPHGYNWTFAFPLGLFVVVAVAMYLISAARTGCPARPLRISTAGRPGTCSPARARPRAARRPRRPPACPRPRAAGRRSR